MPETRDWKAMRDMSARLLEERTGEDAAVWNERIKAAGLKDEPSLRAWLTENGVTGYAQTFLVMERFGYPDWYTATADELVDGQYDGKPELRAIYDAILAAAAALGSARGSGAIVIQTRKTYVSLVTPRRTFARIQAAKDRVNLALRLESVPFGGRLAPSKIHETMPVQISFESVDEVDAEALGWLQRAYEENT